MARAETGGELVDCGAKREFEETSEFEEFSDEVDVDVEPWVLLGVGGGLTSTRGLSVVLLGEVGRAVTGTVGAGDAVRELTEEEEETCGNVKSTIRKSNSAFFQINA